MRRVPCSLVILVGWAATAGAQAPAAPAGPPPEPPVVVVPMPGPNLTPAVVTAVRDAVVEQLGPVAPGRPTVALTDEQRLIAILECAAPACIGAQLAEAGAIAGVLVRLSRPRGRGPLAVTLEVVDPVSGAPRVEPVRVEVPEERLEAPAEALRAATAQLAGAMPAPPPRSTLLVAVNVDGAAVRIDGGEIGRSPVGPIEVPPGRHAVNVSRAGFVDTSRSIEVGRGEDARLDVLLEVDPSNVALLEADAALAAGGGGGARQPWYTRWYVIAGGGAVVAALLVGTVVAVSAGRDDGGRQSAIPVPMIE